MKQETQFKQHIESPVGWVEIVGDDSSISCIRFCDDERQKSSSSPSPVMAVAVKELIAYFAGQQRQFSFKMSQTGTVFQRSVWDRLLEIPYGQTWSYLDLAKSFGDVKKVRAVGTANGRNQIAIAVPCHRVIGSDGKLVGYASGIDRKRWLLAHERKHFSGQTSLF